MPVPLPGGIGFGLHWAWVPFFGFIFGAATIISLLVIWLAQGHPRYRSNESTVVYISDVGADNHALFIVLGTLTALFFFASIYLDYRLRHTYRIPTRVRRYERAASGLSLIFAFICALGCILLTIFDAFAHPTLHWTFSGIFFVALLLSGMFNMIELGGLARDYRDDKATRLSFYIKVAIVIPGIIAIIILACLMKRCDDRTPPGQSDYITCNGDDSAAASLEWFVTTLFCLYIASMMLDLYPSRYTSTHRRNGAAPQELIQPTRGVVQPKSGFFGKKQKGGPMTKSTVPNGAMTNGEVPNGALMNGTDGRVLPQNGSSMV
ncbi:TPA: hypothetical protein ACH3X3_012374 [Trebouxia sp. C0006]